MLTIIAVLILIGTIYCLAKRYETRLVLFCSGMLMAFFALDFMAPFHSFSKALQESALLEAIVSVMGFAMVMKLTECDKHLINLIIKPLRKAGPLLIPGSVFVTMFINISVTSSAGCSAAVGAILIPLLMASGIHPAIAGACIYAGTYGAMMNPGYPQVALISNVSGGDPVAIVANHLPAMLTSGALGALSLWVLAVLLKEHKGYVYEGVGTDGDFKVNVLYALVPLLPIFILITGSMDIIPLFKPLSIAHAMLIGVIAAFLITRTNPQEITKEFWKGAGNAFGHVFGIIVCALVFVGGMQAIGLIQAMMDLMTSRPEIAEVSSTAGPFVLGILSGSGDAAAVAFNKAVTVHAAEFGLSSMDMGSAAAIAGALGRTMSPVAGGMIICAGLAGTSPVETAKRNAPGMILACIATTILLYI